MATLHSVRETSNIPQCLSDANTMLRYQHVVILLLVVLCRNVLVYLSMCVSVCVYRKQINSRRLCIVRRRHSQSLCIALGTGSHVEQLNLPFNRLTKEHCKFICLIRYKQYQRLFFQRQNSDFTIFQLFYIIYENRDKLRQTWILLN